MSDPRPKEIIRAEELLDNGKLEGALEIITNFEKKDGITPKEKLWVLLLTGQLHLNKLQFKKSVEVGEQAYQLSKELEMLSESIEALILKSYISIFGKPDEALNLIAKAEALLDSIIDETYINLSRINFSILLPKLYGYYYKGGFNTALEFALKSVKLTEKIGSKLPYAYFLIQLGSIYLLIGEFNTVLEYAKQSLKLMEELGVKVGIAHSLYLIANVYLLKDSKKGLEFCDKSLSIEEISDFTKSFVFTMLGGISRAKGELKKSLKYYTQAIEFADESINYLIKLVDMYEMGKLYRMKGENETARKYLKQSLMLNDKLASQGPWSVISLLYLVLLNLDLNDPNRVQLYLERLKIIRDKGKNKINIQGYQLAKAAMLKSSGRRRNSSEAELLLKKIVEEDIVYPDFHTLALIFLCELFIEELSMYDNPEVLEEVKPLILQLLTIAENQPSFAKLAEGKLLQAKLSLIQEEIEEAKQLLTEAQQIAEVHGLNLLAQKISNEHDILLEKIDEWDKLKKKDAPMAKRIELASIDGVLNRLKGKRAVEPSELIEEEPILLIIMDNSGSTYLNHPFVANWDHSDLFSSFLSAFNTFSDEIFSKSIDRIRIGENTILINPIESFLACYVIKGQSYPALQKLTRFTEAIRENSEIWHALNKSVKTSEVLELNKSSPLKTVINEIFT
ncbi:MAG: tetratricopeptide repeat protein [Promethearchaeota archaeon]|jgi:tetratricopeptide (TPR) repeat protein